MSSLLVVIMSFLRSDREGLAEKSRCLDIVVLFPMIFYFPFFRFGFRVHTHVYNTWGVLLVLFFFFFEGSF